jgi:cellulose biosynthesis protein BcsQ
MSHRKIMAVYDEDYLFTERFAQAVNRKTHMPFDAIAFRTLENLKSFSERSHIELLLISSAVDRRAVKEIHAAMTVYFADGKSAARDRSSYCVYKYQASSGILREIMSYYGDSGREEAVEGSMRQAVVYAVFSPVGKCGKTSLAVTLGRILSQESPTLLINFEEFSGFRALAGEEYHSDLSDLIYCYSSGTFSPAKLGAVVHSMNGLDYIPPVRYPEDLDISRAEALPGLIRRIAVGSAYRYLVIDVGRVRKITPEILSECHVIYLPERKDVVSQAKIDEFEQYLEDSGRGEVLRHIRKVSLPQSEISGSTALDYFDQLLWGDMGKFAREHLMRENGQLPPKVSEQERILIRDWGEAALKGDWVQSGDKEEWP